MNLVIKEDKKFGGEKGLGDDYVNIVFNFLKLIFSWNEKWWWRKCVLEIIVGGKWNVSGFINVSYFIIR